MWSLHLYSNENLTPFIQQIFISTHYMPVAAMHGGDIIKLSEKQGKQTIREIN